MIQKKHIFFIFLFSFYCAYSSPYNLISYTNNKQQQKNSQKKVALRSFLANNTNHTIQRCVYAHRYTPIKKSSLPNGFKDSFKPISFFKKKFHKTPSVKHYEKAFHKIIAHVPKEERAKYERAQMRQWAHYHYESFRQFIKKLSIYESYIIELAEQFDHDNKLKTAVNHADTSAVTYICSERNRIQKKQTQQKQENQNKQVQKTFLEQTRNLSTDIQNWKQNNPKRYKAYQESNIHTTQHYKLNQSTQNILKKYSCDDTVYYSLHGNSLQHHIHKEIITGLEQCGNIKPLVLLDDWGNLVCQQAVKAYDNAQHANRMGAVIDAAKLVDFAKTLYDYTTIFGQSLVNACTDTVTETIHGTCQLIAHPIKTSKALLNCACAFIRLVPDYVNLNDHIWLYTSPERRDEFLHNQERIAQNWRNLGNNVKHWWQNTPNKQLFGQITYGAAYVPANIICANYAGKLLGKVGKFAAKELQNFAHCVQTLPERMPGYLLLRSIKDVDILNKAAQKSALAEQAIQNGLLALEELSPNVTNKLASVVHECHHVTGITEQAIEIIENAASKTSLEKTLQSCDQLEHVLNLSLSGEKVLGYKCALTQDSSVLFDCVTKTKAITTVENSFPLLKNTKTIASKNIIESIKDEFLYRHDLAQSTGKLFEVHFPDIITRDCTQWLTQENIAYDFIHKIKLDNFLKTIISQEEWSKLHALAKNFSMLDPITGNPITPKINLEHIFLPNIKWLADGSCKISGLHHDYMGLIEQAGLLKELPNISKKNSKFYVRGLAIGNKTKPSGFFPKQWTRKEALQKIICSIKNQNLEWKIKNNKFTTKCPFNELKISICYNPQKKHIDTIFPIFTTN